MLYTHVAAAILAAAVAAFGTWEVQGKRIERLQAQHAQALADARAQAEARATALQETKDEAIRRANQRAIAQQNAADSARSELDRLRDDIAARDAKDAGSPGADAAATARALLNQCAARYSELAAKADRHANDAVTLRDAWPH